MLDNENSEITRISINYNLNKDISTELCQLLEEMRPLKFTTGKELSKYIICNQLGYN
jgi:hypothetical protein